MSSNWYALRVKPHKERPVCQLLEAKEVEVYYPALKVKPINPRARKERPFFPGYMFVHLNLEELGLNALSWTENTYGLVEFGGRPAVVPENLIQELKARLATIQAAGGLVFENLKPGDRVRIISGPFEGYEAIFDARLSGEERVQVLLAFLNEQPKRLQLDASAIQKVSRQKKSWREKRKA